jgi:hypothetical protein
MGFNERLTAAMATVDKKSGVPAVTAAFQLVTKIVTEHNYSQDLEVQADRLVVSDAVVLQRGFTQGKKRMPHWMRNLAHDMGILFDLDMDVQPGPTQILSVIMGSKYPNRADFACMLFEWLIDCINNATKRHLKSLDLGRGSGKSVGTKFRQDAAALIMDAGKQVKSETIMQCQDVTGVEVTAGPVTDEPMPW